MGDNSEEMKVKSVFIGVRLTPKYPEATALYVYEISKILKSSVITVGDTAKSVLLRQICNNGRKITIINDIFINNNLPILYELNGLEFILISRIFSTNFDVIYLIGDILSSKWMKYMVLNKSIHFLENRLSWFPPKKMLDYVNTVAKKVKGIIARSEIIKNQLIKLGINSDKIFVVYPGVDLKRFEMIPLIKEYNNFNFLFASAPTTIGSKYDYFEEKGISLMLESFYHFSLEIKNAKLFIVWRGKYKRRLYSLLKKYCLEKKVRVIDGYADMVKLFFLCHATLIPYKALRNSPEMPRSALESLAAARPVITTSVPEISKIIDAKKCGVVSKPDPGDYLKAMLLLYDKYPSMSGDKCKRVAKKYFDIKSEANRLKWITENLIL